MFVFQVLCLVFLLSKFLSQLVIYDLEKTIRSVTLEMHFERKMAFYEYGIHL